MFYNSKLKLLIVFLIKYYLDHNTSDDNEDIINSPENPCHSHSYCFSFIVKYLI